MSSPATALGTNLTIAAVEACALCAAQRRQLFRKFRIILLFLSVIPEILQQ